MMTAAAIPDHHAQERTIMRGAYHQSSFEGNTKRQSQKRVTMSVDAPGNLGMQGIARSHDIKTVSVHPQGDLELLGTSGRKNMDDLSVTQKETAAEEDSDASPACQRKATEYSDPGPKGNHRRRGRTYYLNRHSVDCGRDQVMKQWNLKKKQKR